MSGCSMRSPRGNVPQEDDGMECSRPVYVAGLRVECGDVRRAAEEIVETARSVHPRVYVFLNGHSATLRRSNRRYAEIVADSARVVGLADGASVTYVGRLLWRRNIGRAAGPDVLDTVCALAAKQGIRVFFLGGEAGVVKMLAEALCARHPGLKIAGTATPPFGEWSEETNRALVGAVKESGARILFMGVSAPKQEIWAYEHLDELGIPIVCVGAAFDFLSVRKPRAPKWKRKIGLEWLFRLITEPRRLWKRYLIGNLVFLWDVIRYGRRPAPPPV